MGVSTPLQFSIPKRFRIVSMKRRWFRRILKASARVGIPQDQTTRSLLSEEISSATILFECKRSPCYKTRIVITKWGMVVIVLLRTGALRAGEIMCHEEVRYV